MAGTFLGAMVGTGEGSTVGLTSAGSTGGRRTLVAWRFLIFLVAGSLLPGTLLLPTPHSAVAADSREPIPSIEEKTKGMEPHPGFLPFYWDSRAGTLWLEVPMLGAELLYVVFLESGLGSNPVGLDRGQIGPQRIVRFDRTGPKVRLLEPNRLYRADSPDPAERRAVEESFANSVLWAGDVAAESDGRVLVDVTTLCLSDAHGVAKQLESAGEGSFLLDVGRSVVHLGRSAAFPENTEISVDLTFAGGSPGDQVRQTTPSPESVTLRLRHSFLRLPPDGFRPRRFDPRIGGFFQTWLDYATPLREPIRKRFLERHRLEKTDPTATASTVVQPIVYYVDRGAPEPVRSALVEGASWWTDAFESAGFRDAFRVELLPEGADPLDARYNVIQWVHRATRGWSYGSQIVDPRTGEIVKGHVSLGSLRVRQDIRIFEGLFGPGPLAEELALARIRQLAAHEVGHTLGFVHNFAASASGRTSVMDYPAPWIRPARDRGRSGSGADAAALDSGPLDASRAYDVGIGAWDRLAARYLYGEYVSEVAESAGLDAILEEAATSGLNFLSDDDARPAGAGHPLANLWDNGDDPIAALDEVLEVRRIALSAFGPRNLAPGRPLSELEDTLVPIYLLHRYQVEAVVKSLGGAYYRYDVVGEGGSASQGRPVTPVSGDRQRRALDRLLATLAPEALALPPSLLGGIPPVAYGYEGGREAFPSRTAMYLDPIAIARTAADLTVGGLLQPERAQRLIAQQWSDPDLPGFQEVVRRLIESTWDVDGETDAYHRALRREVQRATMEALITLAADGSASPDARAVADETLRYLSSQLGRSGPGDATERRHRGLARDEIERFLARAHATSETQEPLVAPPGSPIGNRSSASHRCEF